MGKHAKLEKRQKWSNEKLHLENARKLRGTYFIDPEDKEFKETIKNTRKKLETSVAPAMPCKIMKKNCGSGGFNKIKTKLACILEADESTSCVLHLKKRISSVHNVCKITTGKSYDELLQHENKMRIWARSKNPEKWKIYEWVTKHNANANDDIYACVTLHNTNVNDNIYASVAPHDAYTIDHIH